MSGKQHSQLSLLAAVTLLFYFGLRLWHLLALPLFIDEALSGVRSLDTLSGSPLWFAEHGKLLLPWWGALFFPYQATPFLIRVSALLLALLSAAVVFALAKRLYGTPAGFFALLLLAFNPMLFFFDRLALSDTTLHAMITLFIFALHHLLTREKFHRGLAILTGGLLILCILAKATALSVTPLPLLALFLLPRWAWRLRFKAGVWIYGTAITLWLPLQLLLIWRGIDYLSTAGVRSGGDATLIENFVSNFQFLLDGFTAYFSAPLLLIFVLLIIAGILYPFKTESKFSGFILAAGVFGPGLALLLFGGAVTMRYWVLMLPISTVLITGGLIVVGDWLARLANPHQAWLRWLPAGIVSIWLLSIALPFIQTAYTNPTHLPLPQGDLNEYITYDSSGVGIPEVVDYLQVQQVEITIGAIANCDALAFYAESMRVDCPNVLSGGRRGEWLEAYIVERVGQADRIFVIFESPGYASPAELSALQFDLRLEIPRPYDGNTLQVYEVLVK